MNGHFRSFNPFNPRPEHHQEQSPRVEAFIIRAATMLSNQYTEDQCVRVLIASGAEEHEARHATKAGAILNAVPDM